MSVETRILHGNNARAQLAAQVGLADTTITLASGQGARFPSPGANQLGKMTLENTVSGNFEIVTYTNKTGDIFSGVVRAQEGTIAIVHPVANTRVGNRVTAGTLAQFFQVPAGLGLILSLAGTAIAQQNEINFIQGAGSAISVVDNPGAGRVDVTVGAGSAVSPFIIAAADPILELNDTNAGVDAKRWIYNPNAGVYTFSALSDDGLTSSPVWAATRSGLTITLFSIVAADIRLNGDAQVRSVFPTFSLYDTNATAGEEEFFISYQGDTFVIGSNPAGVDIDTEVFSAVRDGVFNLGETNIRSGVATVNLGNTSSPYAVTFNLQATPPNGVLFVGGNPRIVFHDNTGGGSVPADEHIFDVAFSAGEMNWRTRTDVDGAGATFVTVQRTGTAVTTINFQATNVQVNGANIIAGSTQPGGATGDIQYNNAGVFGGADLHYEANFLGIGAAALIVGTAGDPLGGVQGPSQTGTTGGGSPLYVLGGRAGSTSGIGGDLILIGGPSATGNAGNATLQGGTPTVSGKGGNSNVIAGNGAGTDQDGGTININGGNATGTGIGGSIEIIPGDSPSGLLGETLIARLVQSSNPDTVTGPTFAIDFADGDAHYLTLEGDVTFSFLNVPAQGIYTTTIFLVQDTTGGWEATWPASVRWSGGIAPVLTVTPERLDAVVLTTIDGGTTWFGGQTLADVDPT